MKRLQSACVAFVVGAVLTWTTPILWALVAAAPGLPDLFRAIRSAGLHLQPAYFTLTKFLPALLLSFAVGLVMFRALSGSRAWLFFASALPWVLNAAFFYVDLCWDSPASCTGAYDIAGLVVVPLGLLLAAFVPRPPSLNKSIDTDPQQQAAASPLMLVVRSFLR